MKKKGKVNPPEKQKPEPEHYLCTECGKEITSIYPAQLKHNVQEHIDSHKRKEEKYRASFNEEGKGK